MLEHLQIIYHYQYVILVLFLVYYVGILKKVAEVVFNHVKRVLEHLQSISFAVKCATEVVEAK